jgi:PAS domain S-box-containing protein
LLAAIVTSSQDAIMSMTLDGVITSWNPAAERLFGYTATEAINQPASLLHPPGDDHGFPMPVTLLTSGETIAPYRTRRAHKDGRVLDVELTLWAVRGGGGRVDGIAALFRDVTGQFARGDAKQFDSHRVFEDRLRALTRVSASLTFDQPMEVTLDTLAAGVVEVTHAVACAVALIDEERDLYRVAGTCGLPHGYAAAVEQAYRSGAVLSSLEAYRTQGPVRRTMSAYIRQDPRQAQVSALVQDEGWDSIVSLPLVFRGSAVGAVTCCYPTGVEPDEQELAFLGVVADQAAVAVQTARLFADLQGKAATEERQRLARELHDSVSQALFGIGLGARTARAQLDRDPAKAAVPLDYVVSLAEAGLTEMRALIFELRPDALETEGLVGLLEHQAAALRTRHALRVETDFGPEPVVSLAIKEMLYRIAQEALHNTTKHAQARSVTVLLRQEPDGIVLVVADDGVGFDPAGSFPGHLGLRSMRERASRLGASIEVESAPGRGARTRVLVPAAQ